MAKMASSKRAVVILTGVVLLGSVLVSAQSRKEFRFTVGPRVNVSINNEYGPITVRPVSGNQVLVSVVVYSDKVVVDQGQREDRVDIASRLMAGATPESGRVDYDVTVPMDASVSLHSMTGPLHAEKLHGEVSLEGARANLEVQDITGAHVHIKTLNGPVTLTNIRDGHIEITSISGDVVMHAVSGPFVQVSSNSGKISYDGDFGYGGQYMLTSHTGDIEATAPGYASIDVMARSMKGHVENDFTLAPERPSAISRAGNAFAGTVGKAASKVKLYSFSGKIHLKKRQ